MLGVRITTIGRVQPAYRERITQQAEIDYTHKKQLAGRGEFARVKLVLEPTRDDHGCTFSVVGARRTLSDEFIEAVE